MKKTLEQELREHTKATAELFDSHRINPHPIIGILHARDALHEKHLPKLAASIAKKINEDWKARIDRAVQDVVLFVPPEGLDKDQNMLVELVKETILANIFQRNQ